MKEFYTPYGWKGERYEATKDLRLKDIAKKIKDEILMKHPNIKVSVRSEYFSMGCAIRINVKQVPFRISYLETHPYGGKTRKFHAKAKELLKDIQGIADQYRYNDSDAMIDYFNTNFYCTPSYDWKLLRMEDEAYE